MERLTKRELIELKNGDEIVSCDSKDEDCTDMCMYGYCRWNDKALKKLKEYEDLKEQGLLLKLPLKIGDTVWTNLSMSGWYFRRKDAPYYAKVVFIGVNDSEEMGGGLFNVAYRKNNYMMSFKFSDIGKTVFLTKEEAEAALKEMEK